MKTRDLLISVVLGGAALWWWRRRNTAHQGHLDSAEFVHAAKLPAWLLRLESATTLLEETIEQRNRAAIASAVEDVWFWLGRVLCDAFSVDATRPTPLTRKAAAVIPQAYQMAARARQILGAS